VSGIGSRARPGGFDERGRALEQFEDAPEVGRGRAAVEHAVVGRQAQAQRGAHHQGAGFRPWARGGAADGEDARLPERDDGREVVDARLGAVVAQRRGAGGLAAALARAGAFHRVDTAAGERREIRPGRDHRDRQALVERHDQADRGIRQSLRALVAPHAVGRGHVGERERHRAQQEIGD
jgi:hypothetical protein